MSEGTLCTTRWEPVHSRWGSMVPPISKPEVVVWKTTMGLLASMRVAAPVSRNEREEPRWMGERGPPLTVTMVLSCVGKMKMLDE